MIGIFDSGLGGLDIMRAIIKELPEYDFVYLGDTARVPYGNRSLEMVTNFTQEAVSFLLRRHCQLIILACNTASSKALHKIQNDYLLTQWKERKILGVLIPASEEAVKITQEKRVGVIATTGTISSGAFSREIKKIDQQVKVYSQACPLLVPLIEAGEQNSQVMKLMLKKYLYPLINKKIDTLILGCTHYGVLENTIQKIVGDKVKIIAEPKVVAYKLKKYLFRHPEIENKLNKTGQRFFYATDVTKKFQILGSQFLDQKIEVQKIDL